MRRPMGGRLVPLLLLLLFAGACAPAVATVPAPLLDREGATALLIAAEAARADAFASADPQPLRTLFSDSAIAGLRSELARLRQRGQRIEERATTRRLVHWAAAKGSGAGVLEVAGEQRISLVAGPPRAWSRIVRQWSAVLSWTGGRWLVFHSADLPPDQWWRA